MDYAQFQYHYGKRQSHLFGHDDERSQIVSYLAFYLFLSLTRISPSYFGYTMRLRCGIPSITLLGEKSDYESLLSRLIKLSTFGQEPHALSRLLTPILTHFVNVFEVPPVPEFWNTICHYKSGSGGTYIGGWISAFCPWNSEGTWLGHDIKTVDRPLTAEEESFATSYETMDKEYAFYWLSSRFISLNVNYFLQGEGPSSFSYSLFGWASVPGDRHGEDRRLFLSSGRKAG